MMAVHVLPLVSSCLSASCASQLRRSVAAACSPVSVVLPLVLLSVLLLFLCPPLRSLVSDAAATYALGLLQCSPEDVYFSYLPLPHIFERAVSGRY
jgi:hypothetical protein